MEDDMRQILEMLLKQLQDMVLFITNKLEECPPELSIEEQHLLEIGRAVHAAAQGNGRLFNLFSSGKKEDGSRVFLHEDYAGMIESLIEWETEMDGYDRDSVKEVYDAVSNILTDPAEEIEEFMTDNEEKCDLWSRIKSETDYDPSDIDEVIEALNNCPADSEEVKDLIDKAYMITQNW